MRKCVCPLESTSKCRRKFLSWVGRFDDFDVSSAQTELWIEILCRNWYLILKFKCKIKGPRMASTTSKRINFGDSQGLGNRNSIRRDHGMENPEIHWKLYNRIDFQQCLQRHLMEKEDIFNKRNHRIFTWEMKERARVSCRIENTALVGARI